MRFTPAAILLASVFALSASSSSGKKADEPAAPTVTIAKAQMASPQAVAWAARGATALEAGDLDTARNAYETALLLAPGDPNLYFALGKVARAEKRPGRAIKYFDDVLRFQPENQNAVAQQGLAMMDKGAIESARQTLAQLKTMCKTNCAVAEPLAAAIAAGPPKIQTADASGTDKTSPVSKN